MAQGWRLGVAAAAASAPNARNSRVHPRSRRRGRTLRGGDGGSIDLGSTGPQAQGWMVRHPLLTAVVIIVAIVWAASALGVTGAADPDARERSGRKAADRQDAPDRKGKGGDA